MQRGLVIAGLAMLVTAGATAAGIPNPGTYYADPCLITCPQGDSVFVVSGRDPSGYPYENGDVVLDFSLCTGVFLYPISPGGPFCCVVTRTDVTGTARFPLAAGGGSPSGRIKIYFSGVLLAQRPPIASFDQNADQVVNAADVALIDAKIGTVDATADFNCDGSVTAADHDIAAAHLGHAFGLTGVGEGLVVAFAVRALPNPSHGPVEFVLRAPEAGRAEIAIFDVSGRRLATALDREVEAGVQRVPWTGRDESGRALPASLYLYRARLGAHEARGTLIVTR